VTDSDTKHRQAAGSHSFAREDRSRRLSAGRALAAIGGTTLALTIAQVCGFGAFIVLAFGSPIGFAILAVVFLVTCSVVVGVLKLATGRAHVVAAAFVTVATAVMLVAAVAWFGSTPMIWVWPSFDLAYLLIASTASLMLGLFIGPLWLRIVGAGVLCAVVVAIVWNSVATRTTEQARVDDVAQAQRDANFEAFLASGVHPMVPAIPGAQIARIVADGGPAQSWTVTADGGVVRVDVNQVSPEMADAHPCWWLAAPNTPLEMTDTLEGYADFCVRDADGWARPDGTGVVRIEGDRMIAVVGAHDEYLDLPGASRAADAGEVAAAAGSLRELSEAELRDAVGEAWHSGTF
jgi:hypothetical protein